jgi:hypothetical protein
VEHPGGVCFSRSGCQHRCMHAQTPVHHVAFAHPAQQHQSSSHPLPSCCPPPPPPPCLQTQHTPAPTAPRALHYADLGGVEDVLADIRELIEYPLKHPEVYRWVVCVLKNTHLYIVQKQGLQQQQVGVVWVCVGGGGRQRWHVWVCVEKSVRVRNQQRRRAARQQLRTPT